MITFFEIVNKILKPQNRNILDLRTKFENRNILQNLNFFRILNIYEKNLKNPTTNKKKKRNKKPEKKKKTVQGAF